jgi:hypothetical protein
LQELPELESAHSCCCFKQGPAAAAAAALLLLLLLLHFTLRAAAASRHYNCCRHASVMPLGTRMCRYSKLHQLLCSTSTNLQQRQPTAARLSADNRSTE